MNKTKVMFVLDASPSINDYRLTDKVLESLDSYIDSLALAETSTDEYEASVVTFDRTPRSAVGFTPVSRRHMFRGFDYRPQYGDGTALIDAIDFALKACASIALVEPETAFLIIVLTDGEENSSVRCTAARLKERLEIADASGKYTLVVNCPAGRGVDFLTRKVGVPAGNIKPWEQTKKGLEELTQATRSSIGSYTQARSAGVTRTQTFYADTVGVDVAQVKSQLDDITAKVKMFEVTEKAPIVIRPFFQKKMGRYDAGRAFYELIKSEKVQPQKSIVILDESTGKFYSGWNSARLLLGLPAIAAEIRLRPGRQGKLRVFIQSTSWTRKLKPGQRALHVDG